MATLPGGYPPPPPGYGYPPPAGYPPVQPNPWLNPAAPVKAAGPTWMTVVLLLLATAVLSVVGTLLLTSSQAKPSALGNGESTSGPSVANTLTADADMATDLKVASIAEQSYATDHNGTYVFDHVQRGDVAANHALVQQGLRLQGPVSIEASVFTVHASQDSYCLRAVSTQSPNIWYLSSMDDVVTRVKPTGCV